LLPIAAVLLTMNCGSLLADSTHRSQESPTVREMTPAEWKRLQLAAADKSEEIMRRAQTQSGLLAQYLTMQSAYDANKERAFRLIFGQYLSWFQTWIGDYEGAAKSFSIAQPAQADDAPSPLTGDWQVRRADEAVLDLAKDRKAIFFNEAHSAPITRTLTVALLARLRAQGFTHFSAETLYASEIENLHKRGYPIAKDGFYVQEPIYGEMVRAALKLGFTVVAYDVEDAGTGDARERAGAQALFDRVFKRDPKARLIVNAGFGHIQKSGVYLGGSSMATFFKKISGIDPLCIEQTMLIAHPDADQDHPYYGPVMQASHSTVPFVFVRSGKAWSLKPQLYDVSVFFPRGGTHEGRPNWVDIDATRRAYPVGGELCRKQFPCLIEARYENEDDSSVAADRTLLNVVDPDTPLSERLTTNFANVQSRLYLFPGKFHLTAIDRHGRVQYSASMTIGQEDRKVH